MITTRPYQFKISGNRAHSHRLFRGAACIVFLLFIILAGANIVCAQVRVTGHVFAEIVEPTSLTSKATNSHLIETNSNTIINELVIAQVKLSGGQNMNVDVAIISSHLVSSNGEILPFDAIVCPVCSEDNQNAYGGEKLFTLKATPGDDILQKKNNTYRGGYSVVFMYN